MKKENTKFSIHARIKSFGFALKGIKLFFLTQHNAWIHLAAAIVTIIAGFYFHLNTNEWCWIVAAISLVFICEAFNTAIEFLTDLVSPDYNEKAGKVKDLAAGAVLIASITALVIGLLIFLPKIMHSIE